MAEQPGDRLPLGLVAITSPGGQEHLVDEFAFTTSHSGHWRARCGAMVMSAPLASRPGRPCAMCSSPTRPTPRTARARTLGFWTLVATAVASLGPLWLHRLISASR
jgi:hypothetical protein